jgi:hypothetical protein
LDGSAATVATAAFACGDPPDGTGDAGDAW